MFKIFKKNNKNETSTEETSMPDQESNHTEYIEIKCKVNKDIYDIYANLTELEKEGNELIEKMNTKYKYCASVHRLDFFYFCQQEYKKLLIELGELCLTHETYSTNKENYKKKIKELKNEMNTIKEYCSNTLKAINSHYVQLGKYVNTNLYRCKMEDLDLDKYKQTTRIVDLVHGVLRNIKHHSKELLESTMEIQAPRRTCKGQKTTIRIRT